jgi:glutathione S-transferase
MKLFASLTSPYARKVRIALAEKKIDYDLIEASPWEAAGGIAQYNPLGKIPALVLEDGTSLFDSRVIVEYLDAVSPVSRLIPEPSRQRIAVKRWEALADGICDAAMQIAQERRRPARQQSKTHVAHQEQKIIRALDVLARELEERPWCNGEGYSLADIATGCALGHLDLRHAEIDWRERHANLARLAERLAARPSFADTAPPAA